jgi:formylmethanofuran dehydrogenase subunit A
VAVKGSQAALERELTWNEIVIMTRAAQARALGLVDYGKGYLSEGAEADIAIYPIDVTNTDPAHDYERIINGFSTTEYTIKRGEVVCRRGTCTLEGNHSTYWVKPHVPPAYDMSTDPAFIDGFNKYYSMRLANYPVGEEYIGRNVCMETEASL